ncbi:MAG: hypothetical protein ACO3A2_09140 [Bdellovibrionia bacterium]
MKLKKFQFNRLSFDPVAPLFLGFTLLSVVGCSSVPSPKDLSEALSVRGPTVLNARVDPHQVELNRSLQPNRTPEILADVKDFSSKITRVTLQFTTIPVEIPMENIGGTTWRAQVTPEQLRSLAVSGRTISYAVKIIAENQEGKKAESSPPLSLEIKTPDLSQNA